MIRILQALGIILESPSREEAALVLFRDGHLELAFWLLEDPDDSSFKA
jgi:hypothetical protein